VPEITLHAEIGREPGSSNARRLRAEGKVPGIVYGHGADPVAVAVVGRDLRTALSGEAGANALLSLEAGDQTFLTMAREMQRDPVRGTVTHVDFQIVRRDQVIAADVPVSLTGEALEVAHGDGLVDQQLFVLPVRAKPADIPTIIEVDVSALTIGVAIRVSDLALPPGVTTDLDGEVAIVVGQPPRILALEEEAAPAEGEEAEGAEAGAEGAAATEAGAEAAAPAAESGGEG
jgi:large subunit ribosomal protein L25